MDIFDDETDWDYRKLSYALNTEDDQEMLISMLRNGVYSLYEHCIKTCHFVDAEIEHAKDIIKSKSPFPKCRVTIEHIELIEKINQQDKDIRNEESCEKFYKTFHSYKHLLIYID